jgi:hypothetical protein
MPETLIYQLKLSNMEKLNVDTWELTQILINRDTWTSDKPFKGTIKFCNKQAEEIAFNIPSHKLPPIIALIADSCADTAKKIGVEISRSLSELLTQTALPPVPEAEPVAPVAENKEPSDLPF